MITAPGEGRKDAQSSSSASFLVRMWREAQSKGEGPVRVYLRNLRTGEEFYLGNPMRVGEVLAQEAEIVGRTLADDDDINVEATAQAG